MTTQTISDIQMALDRISTGWRIRYWPDGRYVVRNIKAVLPTKLTRDPAEAKATYKRLTEAAS